MVISDITQVIEAHELKSDACGCCKPTFCHSINSFFVFSCQVNLTMSHEPDETCVSVYILYDSEHFVRIKWHDLLGVVLDW